MARTKQPRRKRPASAKRRPRSSPPGRPDLDKASRAQLGPDPERRPYRPQPDDASVEDPLGDWPEDR